MLECDTVGEQRGFGPGAAHFIIAIGGGEAEPFADFHIEAGIGFHNVIVAIVERALQKGIAIENNPVLDIPLDLDTRRVAERAVHIAGAVAENDIAVIVDDAVAQVEHEIAVLEKIVGNAQAALHLAVDTERIDGAVVEQAPVIKMREGFVQVEIEQGAHIVVGEPAVLLPIQPLAVRIEVDVFFTQAEAQAVVEQVRLVGDGAVVAARGPEAQVIMGAVVELRFGRTEAKH